MCLSNHCSITAAAAAAVNPVVIICLISNDAVIKGKGSVWFHLQGCLESDLLWKEGWGACITKQHFIFVFFLI